MSTGETVQDPDPVSSAAPPLRPLHYAVPVLGPLVALGLKLSFATYVTPFLFFYPAVMLAGILGGLGPGLLATATSALAAWYWIIPPAGFGSPSGPDSASLAMFAVVGAIMSLLAHGYRRATRRVVLLEREVSRVSGEAKFRTYVEQAPESLFVVDRGGRYLDCNPAAEKLIGVDVQTLRSMTIADVLGDASREAGFRDFSLLESQGHLEAEYELRRSDGETVWVRMRAVELGDGRFMAFCQDMTASHRAQAAIRKGEARYRTLVDALPIGVTEADAGGRNVYSNAAFQEIIGRGADEIDGAGWQEALHPEDREGVTRGWLAAVQAGRPYEAEYRLVRPDGTIRKVHAHATTVLGEDGQVASNLGVIRDVTAEKEAREALDESRSTLEAALASMTDAVFISDTQGNFITFNEAFATFHRFASKDECARTFAEYPELLDVFLPDGTLAPVEQWAVPRALRGETATNAEYGLRRRDTGETWVGSYGFAPVRRDGEIVGSVVVARDVTDRKRAEADLRASEQRFRDVVASADEYVFEMDARGVVTFMSDAAEKVLGYRPEEMVGQSSLRFMGPAEQARSAHFLAERVSRKEKISHFQQEARHRSGRSVWLEISAVPILAADGSFLGYRGAALDVSARHLAEEERASLQAQLAQAQKLESIGRLAGGVAHDFNNLLTVILSLGEDARQGLLRGEPVDPEDLGEILAAGRRAAELTRQLLAFARKQVIAPVVLDLNDHIRDSQKLLRRVIGEDVRIVEDLQPGLWPMRGDPGLLGQVILNLAANARDAMARGGTLSLATQNVTFGPQDAVPDPELTPGDYVRLTVRDTGTGMTSEVLAHVFEPFFTTKGPGQGTGLGLSTVYGIVKQSGAHLGVRSAPGEGTTFEIYFARSIGDGRKASAPSARPSTGTETVLVVEDDARVREVAVHALRSAGYRVLAASSVREAVEVARAHAGPLDALVTDVVMAGGSGREAAARIAKNRPDVKILYMSGYTHDAITRQGVLDEGVNFLPKPFTAEVLRVRVRDLLDQPGRPIIPRS